VARKGTVHVCSDCGAQSPTWMGMCPHCGAYGTLHPASGSAAQRATPAASATPLADVSLEDMPRKGSGFSEVDRVLGGGFVPGAVLLLVGEPGIGKSTLTLQAALHVGDEGGSVLIAAGEESPKRIHERARRLSGVSSRVLVTEARDIDAVLAAASSVGPDLLIVDSIQSVATTDVDGLPGRPAQIEASTGKLVAFARESGTSVLMTGHVTKADEFAGPRSLEHEVDQVLYLEGDRWRNLRFLRAVKNRFGPAFEVGVLTLGRDGLADVPDPSTALLEGRPRGAAGTVVAPCAEGRRILMVEIQALVGPAKFSTPRLRSRGIPGERAELVAAVLERRVGLPLAATDIFLNVVGGLDLTEPGVDLPVAAAIASSLSGRPVPEGTAVIGEIGLAAELRQVSDLKRREEEARRAGFSRVVFPGGKGPELLGDALARLGLAARSTAAGTVAGAP